MVLADISRMNVLQTNKSVGIKLFKQHHCDKNGFVSCSNYEHGYFSAYRHLADENPEFVLYLGDYIYERIDEKRPTVRRHSDGIEAATLPTYRNRYAQYRLDPDLQRLHAEVPSLVTWDDHEVANDYADKWSERFDDPELFLMRRAAAYQAFYEHMPVRPILSLPNGPFMRVYDRFAFGDLIEVSLIDGRQHVVRRKGTITLVGLPPGEFATPIFEVVLGRITIRGSIVGGRQDLAEAIAFAAEGKVRSHIHKMKLEDINKVFANMKAGKIDGRMVMTF